MKKIISVLCALAMISVAAFAQNKTEEKKGNQEGWREKVRSEQIALITSELDLSEAEAQAFWPVYNEVQQQRREAYRASDKAFKALKEGADGKDAARLLDDYLAAKKKLDSIESDAVARYKKVLPIGKVARLLIAEENFRHQQIGRLGGGKGGPRPGERR